MQPAPTSETVGSVVARARSELAQARFAPSPREASLLMAYALGADEVDVLRRRDDPLPAAEGASFRALLARRLRGEPVAYITGRKEFFGRDFLIDARALVPRPETEHLVESVLGLDLAGSGRIVDVGTGSGCVAITLALELPGSRVLATDVSPDALRLAEANRALHGLGPERLGLLCTDLLAGVDSGDVDLVVSNPPYIARGERDTLSPEILEHEPELAIFGHGADGTGVIRRLLGSLGGLRPGALAALEIGRGQADAVGRSAEAAGFAVLGVVDDYASIPRVVLLEKR